MKTFVILLSCLVCCIAARRLSSTPKQNFYEDIKQKHGYSYGNAQERQQFLLDVLLQVQKPVANTQLIEMGQELITAPNMYYNPNDVILEEFLQLARNQQILGRNDPYYPVYMTHARQLVGLQRFFAQARDFQVFQKNVAYARLYCNPVMFVDALALAIRDRTDTQDLVVPAMNEILPELYYDDYILYSAQNVDFGSLVEQVTGSKSRLLDVFGGLFGSEKIGRRGNFGSGEQISAKIVLPVENEGPAEVPELTADVQLNVAFRNVITDQLAQTAAESIECGQRIEGIAGGQWYYPQGQQHYQKGQDYYQKGQQYYQQGQKYYGDYYEQKQNEPSYSYVHANNPRLLPVGHGRREKLAANRGYSTYVNPFYGYKNQYGYSNEKYGKSYAGKYEYAPQYGYGDQQYGSYNYGNEGKQYQGQYGSGYQGYGPYEAKYYQGAQYGLKNKQYGGYNNYEGQQYQTPYGKSYQGYGPSYYGNYENKYGQQGYGPSYYGNYGTKYWKQGYGPSHYGNYGTQYGQQGYGPSYYGNYETKYGQQGYGPYGTKYGQQGYGPNGPSYYGNYGTKYWPQGYGPSYYEPYGAEFNYQNKKYGSYYGSGDQEYQSQGVCSYYKKYNPFYASPYGGQWYEGSSQYGNNYQGYQAPYYSSPVERSQYSQGYNPYYTSRHGGQYGYKQQQHGAYDKYSSSSQNIGATKQLSYERRGEILLQTIQDLAARLNIECAVDDIEGYGNQQMLQQYEQTRGQIARVMQQMNVLIEQVREECGISKNSEATLNIIASIMNGQLIAKREQLASSTQRQLEALQQEIANVLGLQAGPVYEVMPLALFYGNLRDPLTKQAVISFAELIEDYRQQLQPYTKQQLSGSGDVVVQKVEIDPLVTYSDYFDADLINLLDQQNLQSDTNNLQRLSEKVVARQQRLNQQPFTISMDIASERPQEVSVRILMVPQINGMGARGTGGTLTQNRQYAIVLDAFVQQLQSGSNYIQHSSRQFSGYNNDATTISQIYRQIMTGQVYEQRQASTVRQVPCNLLLPRGAKVGGGLPVQIVVIVTPLNQQTRQYLGEYAYTSQISGFGIGAVTADQWPLGYPLDRQMYEEDYFNVPNIKVIETSIRYES